MGYRVLYGADQVEYDSLKHSLLVDDGEDIGGASLTARSVDTIAATMPVRVACNTISSLTFGGSVRGWTLRRARATDTPRWDIDLDDWRTFLNRERPIGTFNNVRIDSVVRAIVSAHTTSFTVDVHSYFNAGLTSSWPSVTVGWVKQYTFSEVMDQLTVLACSHTNYDATQPPRWGVGPDRVVRLVGYANSYGTTVTVDDTDPDLRRVELGMIGNSLITRFWIVGSSTTAPAGAGAGVTSILVDNREVFYGNPNSLSDYEGASLYLAYGTEFIPVIGSVNATGSGYIGLSSLNIQGTEHIAIPGATNVVAVIAQPAATNSLNAIGSLTGESAYWEAFAGGIEEGWGGNGTYPNAWAYIAHAKLRVPGQEVGFLRLTTTNSQVAVGGRLAVSLTAEGMVPGMYVIRRVRIAGFDRGEQVPPVYEVEAGPEPRFRIESLL